MDSTSPFNQIVETPIGRLQVCCNHKALTSVKVINEDTQSAPNQSELTNKTCDQLIAYFDGNLKEFDIPVAPHGTTFQQSVWDQLLQIEYGTTISYGALATRLGNLKAVRAVGAANGKNPIPIIIPCHRVIAANGKLQGFALGLEAKRLLLNHERSQSGKYLF